MCHLILLMPIIGLAVFWIWPLSIALPVYLAILVVSGLMYGMILRTMHRPVVTGAEGMIGKEVSVMDMQDHTGHVRVQGGGGIWNAVSRDSLRAGDKARIVEINDLTLTVARESDTIGRPPLK
jgi:membrane-bound serine protease (ClpP class)